jgi:2'-5' RNA ligase
METYQEFLNRINSFQKSKLEFYCDHFKPSLSVESKVNKDNSFKNFYGDTVVFDLDSEIKNKITNIIDMLFDKVPECFCEKIISDTIHMTLHDLTSSTDINEIKLEMENNLNKLKEIIEKNPIPNEKIKMKTNFVTDFGHVNLVLALCPINEEEYLKLMRIRNIVDKVKELDFKFKPHVTLAYFNSKGFDVKLVNKLMKVVRELNMKENFEVVLDTSQIFYQRFENMNSYENIYRFAK